MADKLMEKQKKRKDQMMPTMLVILGNKVPMLERRYKLGRGDSILSHERYIFFCA
jgi:hypothetical protein